MARQIEIVEVGPRDGLQNDPANLTVEQKVEFIERLKSCGVSRVEAGSFVSPRAVPKMADSGAVFKSLGSDSGLNRIALALNEKGVRYAIDSDAEEINFVLVASEGFGLKNQGMTPEQSLDLLRDVAPLMIDAGTPYSATISVAFGDPYSGNVDPEFVAEMAGQAARAGAIEIAFGDTIGVATPWAVRDLINRVSRHAPDARLRMHFHDTRGSALANVYAAIEGGVDIIDASCGGIGGCPFAPAATGNVATEDVVFMLERAGFSTGIDLDEMIRTAEWLETVLEHPVSSSLVRAGTFP
ncbi:MAG: hydroxymethylglutaryl-CoA lyase [Pseudomonadota bacterium]